MVICPSTNLERAIKLHQPYPGVQHKLQTPM